MKKIKLVYVFLLTLVSLSSCFNCDKWLNRFIKTKQFSGEIILKYETEPCFGKIVLSATNIKKNEKDTLSICICGLNRELWEYIELGDSIIKQNGNINLLVVKKTQKKSFKYPCCDH